MKNNILKLLVLITFFVILSGKISILNIVVGFFIAILVVTFNKDEFSINRYVKSNLIIKWIKFIAVLFGEVVKANIQVAIITLSKNMNVNPVIVTFKSSLEDEFLLTILANAITLTPGTMTVDISGNLLLIHCLNKEYSEGLYGMKMESMLIAIEGDING